MVTTLSELCLACGLCCDGSLFKHVRVTAAEREQLVPLGIAVAAKRGADFMALPCGKLDGRACTIYGARPGGCRRFVCAIGRRLEQKEAAGDEALRVVRELQARVARLAALWPPPPGVTPVQHARASLESPTSRMSEEAVAALKAVEAFKAEHFTPPPG